MHDLIFAYFLRILGDNFRFLGVNFIKPRAYIRSYFHIWKSQICLKLACKPMGLHAVEYGTNDRIQPIIFQPTCKVTNLFYINYSFPYS